MGHEALGEGMKIDGQEPINVYFLDNGSKMMLCNRDCTAKELADELARKIGFNQDECEDIGEFFSFYESVDGQLANRPIQGQENIVEVQSNCAKVIYMMKLFMESAMNLTDRVAVKLMFVQAHHNIVTGYYYCPISTVLQLAGILMYHKFGEHVPAKHTPGFIPKGRLYEFIPATIFAQKKPDVWEREIYRAHASLGNSLSTAEPMAEYLKVCRELDCYGCAFFEAKQYCLMNFPPKLLIGINAKGIWLMKLETRENLELFKLSEIYRWGFKPGMNFYFEAKGKVPGEKGPVYEFTTGEGNRISELLTDYAHALLKELGISRKSASKPPPPDGGPPPPPPPPPASKKAPVDEDEAAVRVQAAFRGAKLRGDLEKEYATIQIQALWRGYSDRVRFDKMIEALEAQLEDEDYEDEEEA
jgi:hypothetical protein